MYTCSIISGAVKGEAFMRRCMIFWKRENALRFVVKPVNGLS